MKISLVLIILSTIILLDQTSKRIALEHRHLLDQTAYLNGLVRFMYAENTGLFSSFGDNFPEPVKFWLFTVLVSAALTLPLVYCLFNPKLSGWITAGVAMIFGGGMSNVIDRFQHQGAVIDFVYFSMFGFLSDIFNLADVMITLGGLMILLYGLSRLMRKRISAE